MAETYIFLTRKDFRSLSEFILTEFKAVLWAEKTYDSPNGESFTTYDQIEEFIEKTKNSSISANSFFIVSENWSIEPIYYTYIEPTDKRLKPFYSANQKYGGPSIQITPCYYGVIHDYTDKIVGGSISDYPYYISGSFLVDKENGYKTFDRPEALKDAMNKIRNLLRKNGKKVTYRKDKIIRTGYAMTDCLSEYKRGIKLQMGDQKFTIE